MIKQKAWVLVSVLLVAAVLLSGCGAKSNEEFVFGLVLVGPYNDHGWSEAHYRAAEAAVAELPNSKFIHLDSSIPPTGRGQRSSKSSTTMVSEGATLIFTTSDDFAVDTDSVAAKYPGYPVRAISGDHAKTARRPATSPTLWRMEYKAIAGCAAALKTETGAIGYLGPVINDETRRLASSAYLGAREC